MSDGTTRRDLETIYLAPITAPTEFICRRLRIPYSSNIIYAVNDVIARLSLEETWQASANVSQTDMAILMAEMFEDYSSDMECEPVQVSRTVINQPVNSWANQNVTAATATVITGYSDQLSFTLTQATWVRFDYQYEFQNVAAGNAYLNVVLGVGLQGQIGVIEYDMGRHYNNTTVFVTAFGSKDLLLAAGSYDVSARFYRTNANVTLVPGRQQGLRASFLQ